MIVCLFVGLLLLACQGWTQYLAYHYAYHALLGTPWGHIQAFYVRHSLYLPWQGFVWTWQWGSTAARVVPLVMALLALLLSLWSLRINAKTTRMLAKPPPMTGHGTTQWATRRDIKKAGLL